MKLKIHPFSALPKNLLDVRADFDCGEPALNRYLTQTASQHEANGVSRVYCGESDGALVGYYALAAGANVHTHDLPPELAKKHRLPNHPLPAARLTRLAIALCFQRKRFGELLLYSAMSRVLHATEYLGCTGLVVDAKEPALDFYLSAGFRQLLDDRLRLFMSMADILEIFSSHGDS